MPLDRRSFTPPAFQVPDVEPAASWYRAAGFVVSDGEPGSIRVSLGRGAVIFAPGGGATLDAHLYVSVEDVAAIHARLGGSADTLHDTHFGMREFTLTDPNGLRITFGQPIADHAAARLKQPGP